MFGITGEVGVYNPTQKYNAAKNIPLNSLYAIEHERYPTPSWPNILVVEDRGRIGLSRDDDRIAISDVSVRRSLLRLTLSCCSLFRPLIPPKE